ncbi:MAG: undecaprenyl-diphosphate phosphatase [Patescibacteria group bacterium]|nr:undecaprenyl-diphosphate phosphatase [Patescibacteria group bacterium]MDD4304580.1 undecaprenyl-diphosphate phosphatase [Patescibacteria group bacterium]MDD4695615.1 undecaprenyl-diphosphate phosphatase [Patescibacteria group bacterium]
MFIDILFLSLLQAVTEFFPVSSSGHLILFHKFLGTNSLLDNLAFDVVLHGGSLLAIIIFFYKDIINISKTLFSDIKNRSLKNSSALIIFVAIIPAGLVGYFFEDFIDSIRDPKVVVFALIFGAVLFLIADKYFKRKKDFSNINFSDGIFIGLLQCLSFIPGISRSGITIFAGMGRGLSKIDAARFSFIMATPLLFGAFIKKITDIPSADNYYILLLGFIFTAFFSFFAVKFLMNILSKLGLKVFAYYRIILAIIIIIFFL